MSDYEQQKSLALSEELEALIDLLGLESVLSSIASICLEKADHIESNWQDASLSKCWETASGKISRVFNYASIMGL